MQQMYESFPTSLIAPCAPLTLMSILFLFSAIAAVSCRHWRRHSRSLNANELNRVCLGTHDLASMSYSIAGNLIS